jgi:Holliday junction resolvase RusA-like endonuclease
MRYLIEPIGKPRMTQADKWKSRPCVVRYRKFKDAIRLWRVVLPDNGADIKFVISMPKSWSKKRKKIMDGKPHQQVPDIDNLLKALLDSIHKDDRHIWHLAGMQKVWGLEGYIEIK